MEKRIAIQGFEGSFHQEAANQFFGGNVKVLPCATFRETVRQASDKKISDGGVMAIENSIAGSILPNYNLLQKSNLHVIGEIYLQIRQHLMVNPGVGFNEIREVHSHPMAILQCMDYLEKFEWKVIESEDTALSAQLIHQHHNKHAAAIAGKLAAKMYGLDIIVSNIHTLKNNYTRFLILQREDKIGPMDHPNKSSLYFQTDHSKGSLARVLTLIADGGVNLSKLQSFPIPDTDWKYSFYVDMEFDSLDKFNSVIDTITPVTEKLKVYGIYKKGITIR
ncbi:MAG: prephenate dehydratase [Ignavibacteriaceae bacterium]|nr:prephenate dehydratase [Ignavibacteriaceae bacterium]